MIHTTSMSEQTIGKMVPALHEKSVHKKMEASMDKHELMLTTNQQQAYVAPVKVSDKAAAASERRSEDVSLSPADTNSSDEQIHIKMTDSKPRGDGEDTDQSNDKMKQGSPHKSATSLSKFKEKRPEPLDLSVKGSPTSGYMNLNPNYGMPTLETPHIQWQDNEALLNLSKSRLFSTSTTASHRARLSPLLGDSPSLAHGTSFADLLLSPLATNNSLRTTFNPYHSANNSISMTLDSPLHALISSPFSDLSKSSAHDRSNRASTYTNYYQNLRNNDIKGGPRRSCSSDNLNKFKQYIAHRPNYNKNDRSLNRNEPKKDEVLSNDDKDGKCDSSLKKSLVSPLATKSFSRIHDPTAFLYANSEMEIESSSDNSCSKSPISNRSNFLSPITQASTPTCVSNATTNLFNIHLHSPNSNSERNLYTPSSQQYKLHNFSFFGDLVSSNSRMQSDSSPMDPFLSPAYYQQNNYSSSNVGAAETDRNQGSNQQQSSQIDIVPGVAQLQTTTKQANLSNRNNSTTLNTPTLISPNRMKKGNLCFLPSPLSPMSSVFELPSPLLMFPHQGASNQQAPGSDALSNPSESTESRHNVDANSSSQADSGTQSIASRADGKANQPGAAKSNSIVDFKEKSVRGAIDLQSSSDSRQVIGSTASDGLWFESVPANDDCNDYSNMNKIKPSNDSKMSKLERTSASLRDDMNMISLITSATEKTRGGVKSDFRDLEQINNPLDITMDDSPPSTIEQNRPATTIPLIQVSNCVHDRRQKQAYEGSTQSAQIEVLDNVCDDQSKSCGNFSESAPRRDTFNNLNNPFGVRRDSQLKRSLSPRFFQARANYQQNERHESSSAPPEVSQRRARSKVKTFDSSSQVDQSALSDENQEPMMGDVRPWPSLRNSNNALPCHFNSCVGEMAIRSSSAEPLLGVQMGPTNTPVALETFESMSNQASFAMTNSAQQLAEPRQFPFRCVNSACDLNYPSHSGAVTTSLGVATSQNNLGIDKSSQQQLLSGPNLESGPYIAQGTNAHVAGLQNSAYRGDSVRHVNHILDSNHVLAQAGNLRNHSSYEQLAIEGQHDQVAGDDRHLLPIFVGTSGCNTTTDNFCGQSRHTNKDFKLDAILTSSSSYNSMGSEEVVGLSSSIAINSSGSAKKYHCDKCSKSFTRSDMLTRHKRLHSGDRPFQCNECKQEFSRSDHLSTHIRTHTGEKPYKCKLCSYSACRKDMITRHMKVHNRSQI